MNIFEYFDKLSKTSIIILGVLLVAVLGVIDHLTGYEISFSIFYLIPIVLIAWFAGKFPAIFLSVLSTVTWLAADLTSGHHYSRFAIPVWNSIMRFGFFSIITYFLIEIRDLLERQKEIAQTDSLTKIANGRCLYQYAKIEVDRAVRFGRPITIVFIDIDNFKQVNDNFGHSEGDKVLNIVANTIKTNIRSMDLVARFGGDEFIILMPETGEEQAKIAIDKVLGYLLDIVKRNKWPITFSIGVSIFYKPLLEIDELLKSADALMYSVKESGKNNIKYKVFNIPA